LNFLTRLDGTFTIPKAGNAEHTKENAGGAEWTLDAEDLVAIDQAFPVPARDVPLAML
jgi:diketogulonate reductase-like aldo/keto reductase